MKIDHELMLSRTYAGLYVVVVIFFVYLYQESIAFILHEWSDSADYHFAPYMYPLALYLIWDNRAVLAQQPVRPNGVGLLLIGLLLPIWLASSLIGFQIVEIVSVFGIFFIMTWGFWGTAVCQNLKLPLLLILLSAPIWWPVGALLQEITLSVSFYLLRLLGVTALLEGDYIVIPHGVFEVERVCGGLRYFLIALVNGMVLAYIIYQKTRTRILVSVMFILMGLIANWIRVVIVIVSGYWYGMDYFLVQDHETFGWIVYAIFMVITIYSALWLWPKKSDMKVVQS